MKRYRVVLSRQAQLDLAIEHDYLLDVSGARVAAEQTNAVRDYCRGFDISPLRGRLRHDLGAGIRIIGYRKRAILLFSVENDTVTFLRIFHGRQDWPSRFR